MNWAKLVGVLKIVGIIIPVIAGLFSAWFFVDGRFAHEKDLVELRAAHQEDLIELKAELEKELLEAKAELELRDAINTINSNLAVANYAVEQISNVIENYKNRDILNGDEPLDEGDQIRLAGLEQLLDQKLTEQRAWSTANRNLQLQLSDEVEQ